RGLRTRCRRSSPPAAALSWPARPPAAPAWTCPSRPRRRAHPATTSPPSSSPPSLPTALSRPPPRLSVLIARSAALPARGDLAQQPAHGQGGAEERRGLLGGERLDLGERAGVGRGR